MIRRYIVNVIKALKAARAGGHDGAGRGADDYAPLMFDGIGLLDDPDDVQRLNRTMLHALRHAPQLYGLMPDEGGWVGIEELLDGLRRQRAEWAQLSKWQLLKFVIWSGKSRYDLRADRIRALYGHSFSTPIVQTSLQPPEVLYHGTNSAVLDDILRDGLKPMGRQYVHLTPDQAYAASIKKRKMGKPVMLLVRALAAHASGIKFYQASPTVWLSPHIPAPFISVVSHPKSARVAASPRKQRFLSAAQPALPLLAELLEERGPAARIS